MTLKNFISAYPAAFLTQHRQPPQPASTTTDTAQGDVRSPGVKEVCPPTGLAGVGFDNLSVRTMSPPKTKTPQVVIQALPPAVRR